MGRRRGWDLELGLSLTDGGPGGGARGRGRRQGASALGSSMEREQLGTGDRHGQVSTGRRAPGQSSAANGGRQGQVGPAPWHTWEIAQRSGPSSSMGGNHVPGRSPVLSPGVWAQGQAAHGPEGTGPAQEDEAPGLPFGGVEQPQLRCMRAAGTGGGHQRGRASMRGRLQKHLNLVNVYIMQLFSCVLLKLELIKSSHRIFFLFCYWHCRITTLRRT